MNSRIWGKFHQGNGGLLAFPNSVQTPQQQVFGQPAETPAPAIQCLGVGLSIGSTWGKKQEHFKWTEVWFSNLSVSMSSMAIS